MSKYYIYKKSIKAGLDPNITMKLDPKNPDYAQEYWKQRLTSPQAVQEESEKYWSGRPHTEQIKRQSEQFVGEQYGVYPQQPQQQTNPYVLINTVPDEEFNIGMLAIENDFIHETNMAKQTTTDKVQVDEIINDAKMKKQMKMDKLILDYKRTQIMFNKYSKDNTLSNEDKLLAKMKYRESNPIYTPSKIQQKDVFTPAHVQKTMSELQSGGIIKGGIVEPFMDAETMMLYGQQNLPPGLFPWVQQVANQRFGKEQEEGISQPPHQALTGYWKEISDEEKQEIMIALQKNPNNLKIILQRLKTGGE